MRSSFFNRREHWDGGRGTGDGGLRAEGGQSGYCQKMQIRPTEFIKRLATAVAGGGFAAISTPPAAACGRFSRR